MTLDDSLTRISRARHYSTFDISNIINTVLYVIKPPLIAKVA